MLQRRKAALSTGSQPVLWLDKSEASSGTTNSLRLPGRTPLTVRIGESARDGNRLRLRGQAAPPDPQSPPGDLFVWVRIRRILPPRQAIRVDADQVAPGVPRGAGPVHCMRLLLRTRTRTPQPPTADQAATLVNEAWRWGFGPFVWLAMTTGARRGEMCALRWEHLHARHGTSGTRAVALPIDETDPAGRRSPRAPRRQPGQA